jgi:ribonuclease I
MEKIKVKNSFTIHGLWPNYKSGPGINCNPGEIIQLNLRDFNDRSLEEQMELYWFSGRQKNYYFWRHEYNKHGHCYTQRYGLEGVEPFFQKTLSLFKDHDLDQLIVQTFGDKFLTNVMHIELYYNDMLEMLRDARRDLHFYITCKVKDDKQYLYEVRIAYDLEFKSFSHPPETTEHPCDVEKTIFIPFDNID